MIFVVQGPLIPIKNGAHNTAIHLINELNKLTELSVHLVYSRKDRSKTLETNKYFESNKIIYTNQELPISKNIFNCFLLWLIYPYRQINIRTKLKELNIAINGNEPILYFGSSYDQVLHKLLKISSNLSFFPADSCTLLEFNKHESSITRKLLQPIKTQIARYIEKNIVRSPFKKLFYVSKTDIEYINSFVAPNNKSYQIPLGVIYHKIKKAYRARTPEAMNLVFTGVMNYKPNEEAAIILCSKIAPALPNNQYNIKIVGRYPTDELISHQTDSIQIIGEVADLAPYLLNADYFISPIISGAGAKNKIIEALELGLIVVGSNNSFSGFSELPPGCFIAESVDDYVAVLEKLSKMNPDKKAALSHSAHQFINTNFSWAHSAKRLLKGLQ
jgi:glycosyltransferase involved in cell wall biosynthesis